MPPFAAKEDMMAGLSRNGFDRDVAMALFCGDSFCR
jgi:hypothetical protein